MARNLGSWWIKDGIDGRRVEAQSFASVLDPISGFIWTEDHGDSGVLEKDFVETTNYTEKVDLVAAVMMSSHGNPSGFSTSSGSVTTSDTIRFGKGDLELFATHACKLLEHKDSNPVWRWIPAFERLHYMFGFHNSSYSGGGQDFRGGWFAYYAAYAFYVGFGFVTIDATLRYAWKMANTVVESSDVEWAYLRCNGKANDGTSVNTYNEKLRKEEPLDPVTNRTFFTAHGSC